MGAPGGGGGGVVGRSAALARGELGHVSGRNRGLAVVSEAEPPRRSPPASQRRQLGPRGASRRAQRRGSFAWRPLRARTSRRAVPRVPSTTTATHLIRALGVRFVPAQLARRFPTPSRAIKKWCGRPPRCAPRAPTPNPPVGRSARVGVTTRSRAADRALPSRPPNQAAGRRPKRCPSRRATRRRPAPLTERDIGLDRPPPGADVALKDSFWVSVPSRRVPPLNSIVTFHLVSRSALSRQLPQV